MGRRARCTELDALTGLPEYRNGGLLLDAGVIVPRDAGFARAAVQRRPTTGSIEWRALTVALLDELAPLVRERARRRTQRAAAGAACSKAAPGPPAASIAAERRAGGAPPVAIVSDGTVF